MITLKALGLVALLTGVGLRLVRLSGIPAAFADEVYAAVDTRSVIAFGRHFNGSELGVLARLTPVLDGRTLAAAAFGTDVGDLRLASVAFGLGCLGGMYLLGRELFDSRVGLGSACILAIMPWHIYFSRVFLPAGEILFVTLLSALLLLKALRQPSLPLAVASAFAAAVGIYVYPVALLTTPLFLLVIVVVTWPQLRAFGLRRMVALASIGIASVTPYWVGRFLTRDETVHQANSIIADKMIWNHDLSIPSLLARFGRAWVSYLSPDFLVFHGDPNVRQSVQTIGQIGWVIGLLGLLGLFVALRRRTRGHLLVIAWLLIYPLGDALTFYDAQGNSVRGILGAGVWALLAGLGVTTILQVPKKIPRLAAIAVVVVGLVFQTAYFAEAYFERYMERYGEAFETGYEPIPELLRERGVSDVPITLHAGYQREVVLEYFSGYETTVTQTVLACRPLPPDVVRFTVLPRIFIIREDRDFAELPECVSNGLVERDLALLRRAKKSVEVLALYPNAPGSRFRTAVLFVTNRPGP